MTSDLIVNEIGNINLHARHKVTLTKIDDSKLARSLVTDQHLIDKLFTLKKINPEQHKACDKYLHTINISGAYAKGSSCWSDYVSSGNNPVRPIPRACILLKVQRALKRDCGKECERIFWKIMVTNPNKINLECISIVIECSNTLINHYWYDPNPTSIFQQVLSDQQ
jgi:hypothetical protein